MRNKKAAILLVCLFLPAILWAARPYVGIEAGTFMPVGEWSNSLGNQLCLRLAIQQTIARFISMGLSGGYQGFKCEHPNNFEFAMKMLIYIDAMAEKEINKQGNLFLSGTMGPVYSSQRATCMDGVESATVIGWSWGGRIACQRGFLKRAYVRYRYVSLDMTGGQEITLGVCF
jgi:hypothetical protein